MSTKEKPDENGLHHILDYELLKEWGFELAMKQEWYNGKEIVIGYVIQDTSFTDIHGFKPISLQFFSHPIIHSFWSMDYLNTKDEQDTGSLFKGKIKNKTALKNILESCVVLKSNKDETPTTK